MLDIIVKVQEVNCQSAISPTVDKAMLQSPIGINLDQEFLAAMPIH